MSWMSTRREARRLLLGLVLLLLLPGSATQARVYIDIDAPGFQQFPVAITDFQNLGAPPAARETDLGGWFADTLGRYLKITGYFHLLDRRSFLEDPKQAGITAQGIRFSDWTAIGAEYLVKGGYAAAGNDFTTEFRLFDTVKGELLVGKRYRGRPEDRNDMVVKFASEILLVLTGEAGLYDTKLAVVLKKGNVSELYAVGFDGSGLTKLTSHRNLIVAPRWSPDGRWIAFTSYRDRNPDGYLVSPGQPAAAKKISGHPGVNMPGCWSPDGKQLLLTLSKDGNPEIYALELATGQLRRLTNNHVIDVSPSWSPDGRQIAFVSDRSGSKQIYLMDADGGNVRRLTQEGNYNASPVWSPRGRTIAFEGMVGGNFQIFTIGEDGGRLTQLTADGASNESPCWSPDGRYLAFSAKRGDRARIVIMNANGSFSRVLYEGPESGQTPSWSPRLK